MPAAELAPERRPVRPPVVQETAAVVAATRPGRVQLASERIWLTAVLLGAVGLLTGWITHGPAVAHLGSQVTSNGSEAERRAAAALLHTIALALTALGLLPEAVLVGFLRRRRVGVRVMLSLFAMLSVVLLSVSLAVLTLPDWRGIVIAVTLGAHAVLAMAGSVFMWLPVGRPRES